jgi:RNA polymerase sigma-70 factor (ECF subfamily)
MTEELYDVSLVARARARDMEAIRILANRYRRVLYTVAVGMLGESAAARQALRTVLLRVHSELSERELGSDFFNLTQQLLARVCLDMAREPACSAGTPLPFSHIEIHAGSNADTLTIRRLTFDERRQRMQHALLHLAPERRIIVALRHLAGLSYYEMSWALDLPIDVVESRLHAGRQQLGQWLLEWPAESTLAAEEETILQCGIDSELDLWSREIREQLLAEHPDAPARADALRELGQLLNALGPMEPPPDLVPEVLSEIAARIQAS